MTYCAVLGNCDQTVSLATTRRR